MQSEVMSAKPLYIIFAYLVLFGQKYPTTSVPARNPLHLSTGLLGVLIIDLQMENPTLLSCYASSMFRCH